MADLDTLRMLADELKRREHFVLMGPGYLMRMCDKASDGLTAALDENERLRAALTKCLDGMVAYGDGTCGIHCESMSTGSPFEEEIALARSELGPHP